MTLDEKTQSLSPARQAEVRYFVDFLLSRERRRPVSRMLPQPMA